MYRLGSICSFIRRVEFSSTPPLASKTETRDNLPVPRFVSATEVVQVPTALPDEFQQATTRMLVLFVFPQMLRQPIDALRQ